ncbi:hypothetical protein sscle_13g095510 [Sclerotinia sclerotiorum 1980 UF-70]|uniref:Uncharacterized protein n=1 Tax=Sclerotinia sclerotiorum (strain ATCC 18683 / 1980 / Ss-1) TaxID=665079 RepID=A0A1D9QIS0_SCLS1|nr:hypothetical protein sscle_13g095510 [Sclerotinia sclerotiorum 1980 UF-70]
MEGLDQAVLKACTGPSSDYFDGRVKLLITLANDKLANFYAPWGVVVASFTRDRIPPHTELHKL